jgi:excisionase family DNA binding protein
MAEKLYTVPEAAEYMRVTRAAIYKWIQQKRIEVVYVGSERRITQAAIDAFIKASTQERRLADDDMIDENIEAPMFAGAPA